MSNETYSKSKGRKTSGSFILLPHALVEHPNFRKLSHRAVRMLIDLFSQFRGYNNGDLAATYSLMKSKGWNSNDQINKALKELIETGWIVKTKQGYRPRMPNLYAVTWLKVDECGGKLDMQPTKSALGYWKIDYDPRLPQGIKDVA